VRLAVFYAIVIAGLGLGVLICIQVIQANT